MYFHLNLLTNLIIANYFNSSNCLIIFNDNTTTFDYQKSVPFVVSNVNDGIKEETIFRYFGCQGIIVAVENPKDIFEKFEFLIKINMERFNLRKYLFIPTKKSEVMDVFESESLKYVSDLIVIKETDFERKSVRNILEEDEIIFGLYTHRYVRIENDSRNVIEIDKWFSKNQSFLYNTDLYPDKLKNQMGRELVIATFTYQPYSIPAHYDGTEILAILEFVNKYNLTPRFIVDEDGMWGTIYDNWTGNGIVGNLASDRSDVGLGSLYTWEREYHFLDFTKPTIRTGITCLAPAPKLIGGWITPFISFSWKMWIMMFVSFLMAAVAIYGATIYDFLKTKNECKDLDKTENLIKSLILTQAIFLLQGLSKIPSNSNIRVIFALILLLSLMTATLYSTGLASNMTVPRYSGTINNVYDLVGRDIKWGANSLAWTASLKDDNSYTYKKVVSNFRFGSNEEMVEKNNDSFAFSIERLHGGYYAVGDYITREGVQIRRLMGEDLYWDFCLLMLRKSSILLPKLDKTLLDITQTGLPLFWEYQVNVRNADMKLQEAVKHSGHMNRPDKTKLSFTHVEGAFALWAVGILVSIVAFCFEMRQLRQNNR